MTGCSEPLGRVRVAQAKLLQSLRADLRDILMPELGSDGARTTAMLMDEILGWVAVGIADSDALGDQVLKDACGTSASAAAYDGGGEIYASSAIAEAAAGIAEEAKRGGERARWAVAAELARLDAENAAAAGWSNAVPYLQPPIEVDRLDAWLRSLPAIGVGHVTAVSQVVGGFSKDTWLVEISGQLAGHSNLVLRRDLPFGPGENCVSDERDLLKRLYSAGVPVPLPLAGDDDPSVVGVPFLIFPRIPGRAVFGEWDAPQVERKAVIADVAACMARFHAVDLGSLGLAEQPRAEAVAEMIALWKRKWEKRRLYPSAILEAAFDWLAANVPQEPGPARLVHGDVSLRNTLIENGRLSGLLDWEFAHSGDPIEDLSYFRLVAEAYVDWSEVLAAYTDAGGEAYVAERAKFYEIWRSTRNATTTATAWHGFVRDLYPASKAAYQGVSLYRFFLRDVAQKLKDVL